jgi:hypothetical protein
LKFSRTSRGMLCPRVVLEFNIFLRHVDAHNLEQRLVTFSVVVKNKKCFPLLLFHHLFSFSKISLLDIRQSPYKEYAVMMLDYQQFLKASKETLHSVSKENFGPSAFGESLSCVLPVGCQPENDILKGVFSPRNPKNIQKTPLESLKERVSSYQSKGWISQQESRKYKALLNTAPTSNYNHALRDLETQLDMVEEKMSGGTMFNKKTRAVENLFSQASTAAYTPTSLAAASDSTFGPNSLTHVDPIINPRMLSTTLSEDQIADLFVETCFFARLGFIQPPCCMLCTYRESLQKATPNERCGRWVVWRRDATKVLHPNQLDGNTVAIKCHAARALLSGQRVDRYEWNKAKKTLARKPAHQKYSF